MSDAVTYSQRPSQSKADICLIAVLLLCLNVCAGCAFRPSPATPESGGPTLSSPQAAMMDLYGELLQDYPGAQEPIFVSTDRDVVEKLRLRFPEARIERIADAKLDRKTTQLLSIADGKAGISISIHDLHFDSPKRLTASVTTRISNEAFGDQSVVASLGKNQKWKIVSRKLGRFY